MGSGQSRELAAFAQNVVAPLAAGKRLRPKTRAIWCGLITRLPRNQRDTLLGLVIAPFRKNRPWRGKHDAAMWTALHGAALQWKAAELELRKLWYHHRDELPCRLWRAGRPMQEELLVGQILRLPALTGGRAPSQLPAHLWCVVADWAVDSVEAAFRWRHVSGGEWGAGLALLLRARWPQLPPLSALLPWLEERTFTVMWHGANRMLPYHAPLMRGPKRKRVTLRWSCRTLADVGTDESLESLGVPWTVREIWCDLMPGTVPPSAPRPV